MRQFREQGTTLLIVSHDRSAIQSLCNRAILLESGLVIKDGSPEEVMDFYNALIADKENTTIVVKRVGEGRTQTSSGTGQACVETIELRNENGQVADTFNVGQAVHLHIGIRINGYLPELAMGYMIKDRLGQTIFGTNTHHLNIPLCQLQRDERLSLDFSFPLNIGPGAYSVSTALHTADNHLIDNFEWRDLALMFNVLNINHPQFVGTSWMPPQVHCQR